MKKIRKTILSLLITSSIFISSSSVYAEGVVMPRFDKYFNKPITLKFEKDSNISNLTLTNKTTGEVVDITGSGEYLLSQNAVIKVTALTSSCYEYHYEEEYNIFDYEAPSLEATCDGYTLKLDAKDNIGIANIIINGSSFSVKDSTITLGDFESEDITVHTVDLAGNESKTYTFKNKAYLDKIAKEKKAKDALNSIKKDVDKNRRAIDDLKKTNSNKSVTNNTSDVIRKVQETDSSKTTTKTSKDPTKDKELNEDIKKLKSEIEDLKKTNKQLVEEKEKKEDMTKMRTPKSFVTRNGKEFHLVKTRDEDKEGMMLLTEVSPEELLAIMNEGNNDKEEKKDTSKSDSLARQKEEEIKKSKQDQKKQNEEEAKQLKEKKQNRNSNILFYLVAIGLFGVFLYYFKVYKKKNVDKNEHDEDLLDDDTDSFEVEYDDYDNDDRFN